MGAERVEVVPIPYDCTDGFQAAHWRDPERYLDPVVRSGMSTFGVAIGKSEPKNSLWSTFHSVAWMKAL